IADFYLPPEGCSYRLAVVSMKKQYPGHAKRVMFGVWSFLRQFMYTKLIVVTDDDVDVRDWKEVVWALSTRVDAARDTLIVENTPIDYLDFASPVAGLGSKIGIDATNKWPGETQRHWGRPIAMDEAVKRRGDALWSKLGLEPGMSRRGRSPGGAAADRRLHRCALPLDRGRLVRHARAAAPSAHEARDDQADRGDARDAREAAQAEERRERVDHGDQRGGPRDRSG